MTGNGAKKENKWGFLYLVSVDLLVIKKHDLKSAKNKRKKYIKQTNMIKDVNRFQSTRGKIKV